MIIRRLPTNRFALLLFGLITTVGLATAPGAVPSASAARHSSQTIFVTTNFDSSSTTCAGTTFVAITLRCAITTANADGSGDTIDFRIADSGCCHIILGSPLPALFAHNTTINGYSEPGAVPNSNGTASGDNATIKVEVDCERLQSGANGLTIEGSSDTVEGISVVNCKQGANGIGGAGILLTGSPVGGPSTTGDVVEGNFLGMNTDGTTSGPNTYGVQVVTRNTGAVIGGSTAGTVNLISGNQQYGVTLMSTSGNTIESNFIGTDRTGKAAKGNGTGVHVQTDSSADFIGLPGHGNVISGNVQYGVTLTPSGIAAVDGPAKGFIQGNLIGVNASDGAALPNGNPGTAGGGIAMLDVSAYTVGGSNAGQPNVVSGNVGPGVIIQGRAGGGNAIRGNFIGTSIGGGNAIPNNGDGIKAQDSAEYDSVGVMGVGADANVIADNTGYGVELGNGSGDPVHIAISRNSFFGNKLGGINQTGLAPLTCTVGPAFVVDTTPNDILPCPLVLAATADKGVTGEACTGCTVEVYIAPPGGDDEGKTWLGTTTAGTCAQPPCTNFHTFFLPKAQYSQTITTGMHIVATATQSFGGAPPETSDFSRYVPVGRTLIVNTTGDGAAPCPANAYSLRCAVTQANSDIAGDEIDFAVPAVQCTATTINGGSVPVCTIRPGLLLPAVKAGSTYIDGYSQPSSKASTIAAGDYTNLAAGDNAVLTVAVDGNSLAGTGPGIEMTGPYDSVEGLSVTNFNGDGVTFRTSTAGFDIAAGNFLGLRADGAAGGNTNGADINYGAGLATIGGRAIVDPNVIGHNADYGVEDSGVGGNIIRSNLIGMTPSDKAAGGGNGYDGVLLFGTRSDGVGGYRSNKVNNQTYTYEGNVIASNFNDGVEGIDTKGSFISGNEIGVDGASDVNIKVGNGFAGILLYMGANNTVGGLPFGFGGNVISGNAADGVDLFADSGDAVEGNVIGFVQGNGGRGVMAGGTDFVTDISRPGTQGERPVHRIRTHAGGPVVGGERPMYDTVRNNVISNNGKPAVLVGQALNDADVHSWIAYNAMVGNSRGIAFYGTTLGCGGHLPGPNDALFCPIITSASQSVVKGTACAGCTVDLYEASNGSEDGGYGEGEAYIPTTSGGSVVANSSGDWTATIRPALGTGTYLTATASKAVVGSSGPVEFETSEFSQNVRVTASGGIRGGHAWRLPSRLRAKHVNWNRLRHKYLRFAPPGRLTMRPR